jgi:hypothetical protein
LIGIEHHEGQPAITFKRMAAREGADAFLFVVGEPVVAGDPGIVLIDLAEALFPVVELAGADADPGEEATSRDVGLVAPGADEINDFITGVGGGPLAF